MEKIVRFDDMTGEPADVTIRFSIGDQGYTIDLSQANADTFNELLAPYVHAAQPVTLDVKSPRTTLSHDERNSVLSYWRHIRGQDVKRVTQQHITEYRAYRAEQETQRTQPADDKTDDETPDVTPPTELTSGRKRRS